MVKLKPGQIVLDENGDKIQIEAGDSIKESTPSNSINDPLVQKVINLIREKYSDFHPTKCIIENIKEKSGEKTKKLFWAEEKDTTEFKLSFYEDKGKEIAKVSGNDITISFKPDLSTMTKLEFLNANGDFTDKKVSFTLTKTFINGKAVK